MGMDLKEHLKKILYLKVETWLVYSLLAIKVTISMLCIY